MEADWEVVEDTLLTENPLTNRAILIFVNAVGRWQHKLECTPFGGFAV